MKEKSIVFYETALLANFGGFTQAFVTEKV